MLDTRDPQALSDAASKAAAAGDYTSAEQFLRETATLQEATLGRVHPDLANTLNNLGIVCEIVDKPAEAEQCFQRAYEIATAALSPDHPFVTTSRKNLDDFRATRGISAPLEPVDPPSTPVPAKTPAPIAEEIPPAAQIPAALIPPTADRRIPKIVAVPVLAVTALVGGLLVRSRVEAPRASTVTSEVASPAPSPAAVTPAPKASAAKPSPAPVATSTPAAAPKTSREPATRVGQPAVAGARLCRDLSRTASHGGDWQCAPPRSPIGPGILFFYTRLKSPVATAVQHRWYRGDTLQRVVELGIQPNTAEGYRTYSRTVVDGRGDWRVELRTKDGVLLHDERFVVR
jgi:hypothetical protein